MTKLIPTLRRKAKVNRRSSTPIDLSQLSDWTMRDIGVFRSAPPLDLVKPFWMV